MSIKKVFFCFLLFLSSFAFADNIEDFPVFKKIVSYIQETHQKIINPDATEQSGSSSLPSFLKEYQKKFNLPNGTDGIGEWQNFSNGQVRLISTTTGFKASSELLLAIHFQPKENVEIKQIQVTSAPDSKETIISVLKPVIDEKREAYQNEFIIPLSLKTPAKDKWDILLDLSFESCSESVCQPEQVSLPLSLTTESIYPSSVHSFILFSLQTVPQGLSKKNSFDWFIQQNKVYVKADFPREIELLKVLLPDDSLAVLDSLFLNQKKAYFSFNIPEKFLNQDEFSIVLLTDKGYFSHSISKRAHFKNPYEKIPFLSLLWSTSLFLLCYPFLFFCLHHTENKTSFVQDQLKQIILLTVLFFALFALCWICDFQFLFNLAQTSFTLAIISLILLWYFTNDFENVPFILLFIIWIFLPKEFLQNLLDRHFSMLQILLICSFWTVLFASIPYLILRKAKQLKKIQKYLSDLIPVFKLPFYIVMFFTALAVGGNFYVNQYIPEYKEENLSLPQNKQTVILFVEHPVSLASLMNKLWGTTTGKMRSSGKQDSLQLLRLSLYTKEATQFIGNPVFPQGPFIWIYPLYKKENKIILNNGKYIYFSEQLADMLP